MKITIWITHISHAHGDDLYASTTEEAAFKYVRDFAEGWWDHDMDETHVKPEDPDQLVQDYFDAQDHESYQIQTAELDIDISKV